MKKEQLLQQRVLLEQKEAASHMHRAEDHQARHREEQKKIKGARERERERRVAQNKATHAQGVELVAIAITVTCGKGCTAAIINRSRTVADVTSVKGPYTVVNVVADVIAVGIGLAVTAAAAQSVFIQAVLVAAA